MNKFKLGIRYTDGSNWKTHFDVVTETTDTLEVGEEIEMGGIQYSFKRKVF